MGDTERGPEAIKARDKNKGEKRKQDSTCFVPLQLSPSFLPFPLSSRIAVSLSYLCLLAEQIERCSGAWHAKPTAIIRRARGDCIATKKSLLTSSRISKIACSQCHLLSFSPLFFPLSVLNLCESTLVSPVSHSATRSAYFSVVLSCFVLSLCSLTSFVSCSDEALLCLSPRFSSRFSSPSSPRMCVRVSHKHAHTHINTHTHSFSRGPCLSFGTHRSALRW